MRRPLSFTCEGDALVASLDEAASDTGLLIVTGGLQVRAGAHGGQARLAARIGATGHPVLRFDRRGIGDSNGVDPGWRGQAPDLAAAVAAFRQAQPQLRRIVGYGLCDAAAGLMLHGRAADLDALILVNPWVVEAAAGLPPAAAIRRRYAARLGSPAEWRRLLSGGIDLRKAVLGLRAMTQPPGTLSAELARALHAARLPATVLLAERDATAIAFADAARNWRGVALNMRRRDSASHGLGGSGDAEWLADEVIAALRRAG